MAGDFDKAELVRRLLSELGVTLSDLSARAVPTVAEYMPQVRAAASNWQLKAYQAHWRRAEVNLADRRLDQVTVTDVLILQRQGTREAKLRSNTRGGRYAGESAVRAMRTFFRMAIADGLLPRGWNPAWEVKVPRRLPSTRRALRSKELLAINHVVVTTGRDVPLDSLLLRLHSETACRRSGALSLRLADLDTESCAVRLREKFGTERWQPISPPWWRACWSTPSRVEYDTPVTSSCGTRTAHR